MRGTVLTPIPGELASFATEGIVASTDGIYDYTKLKFQEEVNAEVDTKLTEMAARIPVPGINSLYGPYESTDAAIAVIPKTSRTRGMTVGIYTDDTFEEWWWKLGTEDEDLVPKISDQLPVLAYSDEYPEGKTLNYEIGERISFTIKFTSPNYGQGQITIRTGDGQLVNTFKADKGIITIDLGTATTEGTTTYRITAIDALSVPAERELRYTIVVGGVKISSNFEDILQEGINTSKNITISVTAISADTSKDVSLAGRLIKSSDGYNSVVKSLNITGSTDSSYAIYSYNWLIGTIDEWGQYELQLIATAGDNRNEETYSFFILDPNDFVLSSSAGELITNTNSTISVPFIIESGGSNTQLKANGAVYAATYSDGKWIATSEAIDGYTLNRQVNTGELKYWLLDKIRTAGDYLILMYATSLGGSASPEHHDPVTLHLTVQEYVSDDNVVRDGLVAEFLAGETTNNVDSAKTGIWKNEVADSNIYFKLENLNYDTNGWIHVDSSLPINQAGESMLKLDGEAYGILMNSGVEYNPMYNIANNNVTGFTAEIIYRTRCIGELNAKVMTGHTGVGTNSTGFSASYLNVTIGNTSALLEYEVSEEDWIHATLVIDKTKHTEVDDVQDYAPEPLMTVYVNGSMCSSAILTDTMQFTSITNKVLLNAAHNTGKDEIDYFGSCEIKAIRFYNRPLRASEVVNNYVASIYDKTERDRIKGRNEDVLPTIKYININDVVGLTTSEAASGVQLVSFAELNNISEKALLKKRYVHARIMYDDPTVTSETTLTTDFGNAGYIRVDSNGTHIVWNYCIVLTQGTSSLAYPVKNYKITIYTDSTYSKKFKTSAFEYKGWSAESKFTLKCDYMEAAHLNNTPSCMFYNDLIDKLVTNGKMSTGWDGDTYTAANDQRTPSRRDGHFDAIKGFPCVVNYYESENKEQSGDGTYVGTYMFNLDKSAASLGFSSPAKLDEDGETVVKVDNPRKDGEQLDNICQSFEGVANKSNSAGCFYSFEDYKATAYHDDYCYSAYTIWLDNYYNSYKSQYDTFIAANPTSTLSLIQYVDTNYPPKTLDQFITEFAGSETPYAQTNDGESLFLNSEDNYEIPFKDEWEYFAADYEARYDWDDLEEGGEEFWGNSDWGIKRMVDWVSSASKNLTTFKNQFNQYFSLDYCLIYYLQMIVFGQVDNAGKNSMWDTWDGKIWRPRPYDLDTAIGLDNSGFEAIDEDAELIQTLSPFKNTGSVGGGSYSDDVSANANSRYAAYNTRTSRFWIAFATAFDAEIKSMYSSLRGSGIYTIDHICEYFFANTSDIIGEAYYNRDMTTKFYYLSDINEYISRMHGNRIQKFKSWMTKRLIFCDTLFDYRNDTDSLNNNIVLRSDAYTSGSPVKVLLAVTTYSPQYTRIVAGSTEVILEGYCSPDSKYRHPITGNIEDGLLFQVPLTAGNKEIQIFGAGNIREVGGFYNLKASSLQLGNAVKLTDLNVSDSNKLTELKLGNNKYLRTLNCNNCSKLGTEASGKLLDLSSCLNLKEVHLDDTKLTSVAFPIGGALKTVSAKNSTITGINLQSCYFLKDVDVSGCLNILSYTITNCASIETINADDLPIESIYLSQCNSLKNVSVKSCSTITTFSISECDGIENIDLESNTSPGIQLLDLTSITSIDPTTNTNKPLVIETLNIKSSNVQTVRFPNDMDLNESFTTFNIESSNIKYISYDITEPTALDMSKLIHLTSLSFKGCINVENITGLDYTGSCSSLFLRCGSLKTVSGKITCNGSASSMFEQCRALTEISAALDFANCTSLSTAFAYCNVLKLSEIKKVLDACSEKLINISNLCYSKGNPDDSSDYTTIPNKFFRKCTGVTSATTAFYNTGIISVSANSLIGDDGNTAFKSVTDVSTMFLSCSKLTTVPSNIMDYFPNATSARGMFRNCSKLNLTLTENFFSNATKLLRIDAMFSSSNVTANMSTCGKILFPLTSLTQCHHLFNECSKCTGEVAEGFFSRNENLTNISCVFRNTSITGIPLASLLTVTEGGITYSASNVTQAIGLFAGCTSLNNPIVSDSLLKGSTKFTDVGSGAVSLAGSAVTPTREGIFYNTPIAQIGAKFFSDMPNLKNVSQAFAKCTSLVNIVTDDTTWSMEDLFKNQASLTNISDLFNGCIRLPEAITSYNLFKNSKNTITNASYIFNGCTNCKTLSNDLLSNMPRLTNASYAFNGCTDLDIDGSTLTIFDGDTSLTNVSHVFDGCTGMIGRLNCLIFDSCRSNITNVSYAFANTSLTGIETGTEDVAESVAVDQKLGLLAECLNLTTTAGMFYRCRFLTGRIPFDIFWTSSVEHLYTSLISCALMFWSCGFNTPTTVDEVDYFIHPDFFAKLLKVEDLGGMFGMDYSHAYTSDTTTYPLFTKGYPILSDTFTNLYSVTKIQQMFQFQKGLGGTLSSKLFRNSISTITNAYGTFAGTNLVGIEEGFLQTKDTSGNWKNTILRRVAHMFERCSSIETALPQVNSASIFTKVGNGETDEVGKLGYAYGATKASNYSSFVLLNSNGENISPWSTTNSSGYTGPYLQN